MGQERGVKEFRFTVELRVSSIYEILKDNARLNCHVLIFSSPFMLSNAKYKQLFTVTRNFMCSKFDV